MPDAGHCNLLDRRVGYFQSSGCSVYGASISGFFKSGCQPRDIWSETPSDYVYENLLALFAIIIAVRPYVARFRERQSRIHARPDSGLK